MLGFGTEWEFLCQTGDFPPTEFVLTAKSRKQASKQHIFSCFMIRRQNVQVQSSSTSVVLTVQAQEELDDVHKFKPKCEFVCQTISA